MLVKREPDRLSQPVADPRPADVCRQLLGALAATEGRRRKRKRRTTPDEIGMTIKRDLIERAIADDPEPEDFETWLLEQCLAVEPSSGGVRAMARELRDEWRVALLSPDFRGWLDSGAPSDDAE